MILRRGADVIATDGRLGTLTDVVIDPIAEEVTHLLIAPDGELQQARVVPLWLTNETADGIRVELDSRHVKQLQRSLADEYVRASPPDHPTGHDLRFKSVLYHPYFEDLSCDLAETVGVPIDDFDVTCGSDVISTNDRLLGKIVGFLVHEGRVVAFIVRSGLVGFTHDAVVSIDSIAEIVADMVLLDIDRHEFRRLPTTTVVAATHRSRNPIDFAKNAAVRAWYSTRDRVHAARVD